MNSKYRNVFLLPLTFFAALVFTGCDSGFQTMGESEYGVVFVEMPRFLGGGLKETVLIPGEGEFVWPWESVYRVDTSFHRLAWGGIGEGDNVKVEDYVETRAQDGNEVGLAFTIQYHIDPKKVRHVIQNVALEGAGVRMLVESVARADIRTHMNRLNTREFFNPVARQGAVEQVKKALNVRLNPEGVIVDAVIYNDHRFERRRLDGTIDRVYQEQIDKTQALNQIREQEIKKIDVVKARKQQELSQEQAKVNRLVEEAKGFKHQSISRGDAYFQAKTNKAEQVLSVGLAEVEGLKKQIEALSGPGGEALLRLSLVKELLRNSPNFVVINSSQGGQLGVDINQIDTNELLRQIGVLKEPLPGKQLRPREQAQTAEPVVQVKPATPPVH